MEKKPNTGALFSRSPDVFKEGSLNINGTDYNIIVTKFNIIIIALPSLL